MIEAIGLKKYFGSGEKLVKAVDNISLEIKKGEFVAIIGSSGSGKTTLLHILGGLTRPDEGRVVIDGEDIYSLDEDRLTVFRRRQIGFIFQNYSLINVLKVYDNIVLPIELDGLKVNREYINEIIKTLGLENRINFLPSQLSGGQQQRVAIARALASKPALILADEPTGNLDSKMSQEVVGLLRYSAQKYNQTIVMITHNEDISQLAHRTIRIEDGKIVED
ncbi:ABC transporter ATP-binding protein [Clostridium paraputrificum]|uniref:ABC transporter ATP-binding protein YtrE n=1 Tax=Clostridium paraputrificum TaxID=29363 RepID=A0A6N3G6B6_9CLOT|nr:MULTISPECIES: ABC transporter ATP-binding protein [Clostridium]MBS5926053.1 ABC transporter ATP-binding protein [Clostridium sp.]MBS5985397.1 ABC transporter ATP-binding protein [Clostridium sp.]MBS7132268.1 ABC transporter ATP-binding protein [Clostridium sp.]MDB2076876.1 ABC transporter ATP-binding protein [Clostridium paraputrificum]MDB2080431.1 ABC transporter ATP-binding protein [Clostridium paraputrificum]